MKEKIKYISVGFYHGMGGRERSKEDKMVVKFDLKDPEQIQDTAEALSGAINELNKAILRVMDLTEALRLETRGLGIEIMSTTKEVN